MSINKCCRCFSTTIHLNRLILPQSQIQPRDVVTGAWYFPIAKHWDRLVIYVSFWSFGQLRTSQWPNEMLSVGCFPHCHRYCHRKFSLNSPFGFHSIVLFMERNMLSSVHNKLQLELTGWKRMRLSLNFVEEPVTASPSRKLVGHDTTEYWSK